MCKFPSMRAVYYRENTMACHDTETREYRDCIARENTKTIEDKKCSLCFKTLRRVTIVYYSKHVYTKNWLHTLRKRLHFYTTGY